MLRRHYQPHTPTGTPTVTYTPTVTHTHTHTHTQTSSEISPYYIQHPQNATGHQPTCRQSTCPSPPGRRSRPRFMTVQCNCTHRVRKATNTTALPQDGRAASSFLVRSRCSPWECTLSGPHHHDSPHTEAQTTNISRTWQQ